VLKSTVDNVNTACNKLFSGRSLGPGTPSSRTVPNESRLNAPPWKGVPINGCFPEGGEIVPTSSRKKDRGHTTGLGYPLLSDGWLVEVCLGQIGVGKW